MDVANNFVPDISYDEARNWADSIISLMSLEEKIDFLGGDRIFFTQAIPRLNIPAVMMTDATGGIHLRESFHEFTYSKLLDKSTSFPSPITLSASWNTALAESYAHSIGEECRAAGIAVLLGPGMNIYRNSQCGRNFEYMGEDPFLASKIIHNYVVGIQSTGTIATLKHFVANNTDYYRRKSNSIVDERTLHEIYLPAFKSGVDAGAFAVMTSYNLLNGEWCGQSNYVISDLLRKELGFKWMVMSDWWSTFDGEKMIKSGLNLEMPDPVAAVNVKELIAEGKVTEQDINKMVNGTLLTLYASGAYHIQPDSSYLSNFETHKQVALQTAREGIVLLKNDNNILPIASTSGTILLTGMFVDQLPFGGGSATVKGYDPLTLGAAMKKYFGNNLMCIESPTDEEILSASKVVLSIGTLDSEGWDRSFELPGEIEKMVMRITSLNPNTIVIVNSGGGINMSAWNKKAGAIVYAWYPGQIGNEALAEIITGKTNPSGKLPITIEKYFKDSPASTYLPKGETLYTGWHDEEEKLRPIYDVNYDEGVFVGYRWYENKKIEPLFPFGFGLSYTQFEYSDLEVSKKTFITDDQIQVSFTVKNTGSFAGAEIAQLYIHDVLSSVPRPIKELKGFEKVILKPGESKKVNISLTKSNFSFWDINNKQWYAEPGEFELLVGSSSTKIELKTSINLK